MAEQQQTPVMVMQAEQKTSKSKTIVSIVLIIVLATLGFYGYMWATSDTGSLKIASFWSAVTTKYNPISWYMETLKGAKEIGSWTTTSNDTAEKIGINFLTFEPLGGKFVPSGTMIAFRYKLDVGGGVKDVPLNLDCKIKDEKEKIIPEEEIIEKKDFEPSKKPEISTEDPLSYSNILCQVTTKKNSNDRIIVAEGKVGFPFKQRGTLKVYFTKDVVNIGQKFFEKEGLKEKLPIKSVYSNEPVELALGVSEENIQPVVIGEKYYPSAGIRLRNRWDGKVTKVNSIDLILPAGVKIDTERSNSPNMLCPFKESTSTGKYSRYSAKEEYLGQIPQFGKGQNLETEARFFCWLEIDESILEGKPYNDKEYSADISYEYEFQPRSTVITLKGYSERETTETPSEPSELRYYLCQEKTTQKQKCIVKCGPECEDTCTDNSFDTLKECENSLPK